MLDWTGTWNLNLLLWNKMNWFEKLDYRDNDEYHLISGLKDSLSYLTLVRRSIFITLALHTVIQCAIVQVMMHWVFPQSLLWKNTVRLNHHQVHLILFNTIFFWKKNILATTYINLIYYELCKWALYYEDFLKLSVDWIDSSVRALIWTDTP